MPNEEMDAVRGELAKENARLKASNAELVAALENMIYMSDQLVADGHIETETDEECDFMETETFCSYHCQSCGCIKRKLDNASAAIAKAKP